MPELISKKARVNAPDYVGWRGELLAQLALARLPELTVYKCLPAPGFDFLAVTPRGFCFFIIVRAFSSMQIGLDKIESIEELEWPVETDLLRGAKGSPNPVILFLFDADTDHGRFLRLDTLPEPVLESHEQVLRFPAGQVINKENLEKLIGSLQETKII